MNSLPCSAKRLTTYCWNPARIVCGVIVGSGGRMMNVNLVTGASPTLTGGVACRLQKPAG